MSADNLESEAADNCCASCGKAEVDDVKLKECDGCDLVSYCSDACQQDHRPEHESECKERSAELRDEILFKQPECAHDGDCPICSLPLPINDNSTFHVCCSKYFCNGCAYANKMRQLRENMPRTCPFCRHPIPTTIEEINKNLMTRAAANDPATLYLLGKRDRGNGNYESAFKYWTKAAALGDADAHYNLSCMYMKGEGVEKDEKKEVYHAEEAAIRGHLIARHNLGSYDGMNGKYDRASKHFIIAANLGYDGGIQMLKQYYKHGLVSKDDFAAALRAHKAAVDATKSPQREMAAAWAREQAVVQEKLGLKLAKMS